MRRVLDDRELRQRRKALPPMKVDWDARNIWIQREVAIMTRYRHWRNDPEEFEWKLRRATAKLWEDQNNGND